MNRGEGRGEGEFGAEEKGWGGAGKLQWLAAGVAGIHHEIRAAPHTPAATTGGPDAVGRHHVQGGRVTRPPPPSVGCAQGGAGDKGR